MEPLNFELARKTIKRYVCSNCWGELEMTPDPEHEGMYQVTCMKCKDETKGYVSQHFVERRRAESEFEERDAIHLLRKVNILPDPMAGKSQADLLKELGF